MASTGRTVLRVLGALAGVVLVVSGIGVAGVPTYNELQKRQQVSNAEPVNATVLDTTVDRHVQRERGETTTEYRVRVTYRYAHGGETYRSDDVTPPGAGGAGAVVEGTQPDAEQVAARYEPNETVTAYYLPSDPSVAFLERHTAPLALLALPIGFGVVLVVVGGVLLAASAGLLSTVRY
jgi:hypothetical protein